MDNFDTNQDIFKNTPLKIKTALAYHEAGHCILHCFSEQLYDYTVLAVSIMPAEGYFGVNVLEINTDVMPSRTKEYYIELIACKLGGRIAEKMYSFTDSAGASKDLEEATKLATTMITQYGLTSDLNHYRTYQEDSYSDTMRDVIQKEVDTVISEASNYAQRILEEQKEALEILVHALLENGMLSASEMEDLFCSKGITFPTIGALDVSNA